MRDRKRHTARRAASACSVVRSRGWGGGGLPPPDLTGITPAPIHTWPGGGVPPPDLTGVPLPPPDLAGVVPPSPAYRQTSVKTVPSILRMRAVIISYMEIIFTDGIIRQPGHLLGLPVILHTSIRTCPAFLM